MRAIAAQAGAVAAAGAAGGARDSVGIVSDMMGGIMAGNRAGAP